NNFRSLEFTAVDAQFAPAGALQKLFVHFPNFNVRVLSGDTATGGRGGDGGLGGGNGGLLVQNPGTPNPGPPASLDTPGGLGGSGGDGGGGGSAFGGAADNSGLGFLQTDFSTVLDQQGAGGTATSGLEIFVDTTNIQLTLFSDDTASGGRGGD